MGQLVSGRQDFLNRRFPAGKGHRSPGADRSRQFRKRLGLEKLEDQILHMITKRASWPAQTSTCRNSDSTKILREKSPSPYFAKLGRNFKRGFSLGSSV